MLQVLEGLSLTPDQFVDLCILCGCDYCGTIKGMLPFSSSGLHHQGILDLNPASRLTIWVARRHWRSDSPEAYSKA